ncbi:MAG: peroxidase family protein, partial [Ilumatobacter sp.]
MLDHPGSSPITDTGEPQPRTGRTPTSRGVRTTRRAIAATAVLAVLASSTATASNSFEGRAINGAGNNVAAPALGVGPGLYARLDYGPSLPFRNAYADGLGMPARSDGPNTRTISNVLADQDSSIPEPLGLNDVAAWWLFHVHIDIAVGAQGPVDAAISVPADDPVFDSDGSIAFRRSFSSVELGIPIPTREILNTPTAFLDNDSIYRTNAVDSAAVREGVGGRLKLQPTASGELVMPSIEYVRNTPGGAGSFLAPPAPVLFPVSLAAPTTGGAFPPGAAIATVLMREHNRVADELSSLHRRQQRALGIPAEHDDAAAHDDAVFDLARAIVEAELQSITYREVLPALGVELPAYDGYDPSVDPTPSVEFATGPFRV